MVLTVRLSDARILKDAFQAHNVDEEKQFHYLLRKIDQLVCSCGDGS
jgi:hypothetical protein